MSLDDRIAKCRADMGLTAEPDSPAGRRQCKALRQFFLEIHGIAVETYSAGLAAYLAEKMGREHENR